MNTASHASKSAVLDAALQVIRSKGYTATTLDDVCAVAGVTKGSFFHHFKGKEEMALEAVEHWNRTTAEVFADAAFQRETDPRDRVLGYIDFRKQLLRGQARDFSCLLGTLVQETFDTHPRIRDACDAGITRHARTVAGDIAEAKSRYCPDAAWDPQVLALYTQATLQGAFILAKAQGGAAIAAQCIDHLRHYVANLLGAKPRPGIRRESAR
jgi:TetR/AcrR family transcriptional regulator, transcriptional repressor for nem operon